MAVVQESEQNSFATLDWLTTTVQRNTCVPRESSPPKNDRFLPVVFLLLLNLDDIMYIDARNFGSCFAVFVFEVKRNALGL